MSAKEIILKPITAKEANEVVKKYHYSGKVVTNSQIHIGVFYRGKLEGALQFGPSIDKRRVSMLVKDTGWTEFVELNRMAFSDNLPLYSESRALAISMKLIKKHAPQVKWVISFADATQCGDGTIYRAANFVLTQIKKNQQMLLWNGRVVAKKTLDNENYPKVNGRYFSRHLLDSGEAIPLQGFQLRYVYFIDPESRTKLTVDEIPYSKIAEMGATMYKGISGRSISSNASDFRSEEGGAIPTLLLQPSASDLLDSKPL